VCVSKARKLDGVFHAERKRIPKTEDSLAERDEFELPVPISE
jgi:hypothetical protein